MVRLSVETIGDASHYVNAVKQREISLRNLQIPAIENLGVTKVRNSSWTINCHYLGPIRCD